MGMKNPIGILICSVLCVFDLVSLFCNAAASNITTGQQLRDGDTIVSFNGDFALGFFSPKNSTSRYAGVWYNNIPDPPAVWVANRDSPIPDKNGVLQIGDDGSLVVLNGNGTLIWTSNSSISSNSSMAALGDDGNILLWTAAEVGDPEKAYWQSFDDPTDTYLPGMKVTVNAAMGENRPFRSWKSDGDPSPGRFYLGVDPRAAPQIVIWDGTKRWWRSGHWTGILFLGVPNMTTNLFYGFKVKPPGADGNAYISYTPLNNTTLIRFRIRPDGNEEELRWPQGANEWSTYQSRPANQCEFYNKCGKYGICDMSANPICRCMKGFEPADKQQWVSGDWSGGCARKTPLQCRANNGTGGGDGFAEENCMKLPDLADRVEEASHSKEECERKCSGNCSCNAYAFVSGIGCLIWTSEELLDVQHFSGYGIQVTLNIRLDDSDLGGKMSTSKLMTIIITVAGTLFLGALIYLIWRFRAKLKVLPTVSTSSRLKNNDISGSDANKSKKPISTELSGTSDLGLEGNSISGSELPMISFSCVVAATNNFSEENKLGQGGFGPVYKGKFPGGQEVAVKRLSGMSGQGLEEFRNEIILIAKLQHRNLVRLLGSCIEPEEKILIYEYMPNKSLDYILFDPAKRPLLDWRKSFNIIEGIARGILYLHRDSRLRVIHRDLKASNVLLDEDMNPKISDFGMARIFGGNQNEANTIRVVGTYGYMSPEYAMEGLFSVKSDVYSFGVLLLEIISGRRNTSFRLSESDHSNLIGYAWHLWNEGKVMDLIDPSIADTCDRDEVLRCVQIGMLCVQDNASHRPTMSRVVLMLESHTVQIELPNQPTMTSMRSSSHSELFLESEEVMSSNEITATMSVGR